MVNLDQIRDALQKAEAKVKRLSAQLDAAAVERDDLLTAAKVIERLFDAHNPSEAASSQSENGQLIYHCVGVGQENALAPKGIIDSLKAAGHDLNADLVRTQLWRMERRNELRKIDGRYWRPATEADKLDDDFAELVGGKTKKAPDAEASEASKEFGRVAELEGPEKTEQAPQSYGENAGSNPAPPSPAQIIPYGDDLSDDIPF